MDLNKKILDAIRDYYDKTGKGVTHRSMASDLGVSCGCVCRWLNVEKYGRADGTNRHVSTKIYPEIARMLGYKDQLAMISVLLRG